MKVLNEHLIGLGSSVDKFNYTRESRDTVLTSLIIVYLGFPCRESLTNARCDKEL